MRAMILCAGYGTRLAGLTHATPKPMLLIDGRPLLEYTIGHLARHGFGQIAINLHFLPEVIPSYFGDGSRWGVTITYSYEPELLGTAGAIKNMERFLRDSDSFLVSYGDILTDQDLSTMMRFHRERQALATLLIHQRTLSNSVVSIDEAGRITGFLERPDNKARRGASSSWVNSGICIGSPEFLEAIPTGVQCDLPGDVFPELLQTRRLYGFPLSGYRCAIDSPKRLIEARAAVAQKRCRVALT